MPAVFANFIDGEWIGASATVTNVNPSDVSGVFGDYAQADGDRLTRAEFHAAVNTSYINAGRPE